jgi:ankyrin repeat protein
MADLKSGQLEQFVKATIDGTPDLDLLLKLRDEGFTEPWVAAIAGDAVGLETLLAADPDAVNRAAGPKNWPPLLYACFSRLNDVAELQSRFANCAQLLLERGADIEAHYFDPGYPDCPLSALYGATGVNCNPLLADVLLRHGANTQDGESIYHAAQHAHIACLEVLKRHGADFSAAQQPWNNTPLYFLYGHRPIDKQWPTALTGIRWLLEEGGADPNVTSTELEETPLHRAARQHRADAAELLLTHGAYGDAPTRDGLTPYALAARHGNKEAMEALRRHNAALPLSSVDELLAACAVGDEQHAQGILSVDPDLMLKLGPRDLGLICHHAGEGNLNAVVAMCAIGFPTDAMDDRNATALHQAAWSAHLDVAEALLEFSAPLDVRDGDYQGTPLDWVCHGSLFCQAKPANAYAEFARMLIRYGAPLPEQDWGSEEVKAALAEARKR